MATAKKKVEPAKTPVVIADNVRVTYKTYSTGKLARAGVGLPSIFQKTSSLRLVEAVKGVSFTINTGDTVGVIGSNGSGKTTLLKCLTGIYTPERGNITIDGNVSNFAASGNKDAVIIGEGGIEGLDNYVETKTIHFA